MNFNWKSQLLADSALQRIGFDPATAWNIVAVVSKDVHEIGKATIAIEFCEMKRVHLENLPNLRSFSSGNLVEWQSLENVVVNQCPNFKKFGLGMIKKSQLKSIFIQGYEGRIVDIDNKVVAYLFDLLDDKFSMSTEYNVSDDEELRKTILNLQSSHFTNLQVLWAKNCKERLNDFLSILLVRSRKIEVINIEECTSIYYFLFDTIEPYHERDGDIDAEKLHQLKELIIEACEALFTIFESHDDRPRTKFPLLSKVKFKSLPNLRQIYKEIISSDISEDEKVPIIFPELECLVMKDLPMLVNFYKQSRTLCWPKLNTVREVDARGKNLKSYYQEIGVEGIPYFIV
ncbi:hypothetical protein VNO80_30301 [Phaseolus coccineus]|uniref:Uncharacterized protein n=1 Tax=Phaseolus coccineus TaxID=3886 RepID=A0AAN9LD04_PHACN